MAEKTEKPEVAKNCPACKKPLKRAKRYYRNGHYYCNKNCWQTKNKPEETAPAEGAPAEAAPAEKAPKAEAAAASEEKKS